MAESEKAGGGRGLAIVLMGQAQSLQRVAETLQPDAELDSPGSALYRGKTVAVPMLLGLATEIALKAWQCEPRNGRYDRSHDLVGLFDSLDVGTKSRLEGALPPMRLVAKLSPQRATMREVLFFTGMPSSGGGTPMKWCGCPRKRGRSMRRWRPLLACFART